MPFCHSRRAVCCRGEATIDRHAVAHHESFVVLVEPVAHPYLHVVVGIGLVLVERGSLLDGKLQTADVVFVTVVADEEVIVDF